MRNRTLFVYGWPSLLGGADTKLVDLLELLHQEVQITIIPNRKKDLMQSNWVQFVSSLGIKIRFIEDLPRRLNGWALALSNPRFFSSQAAYRLKDKGLKIIWSSEMMWHHYGEIEAIHSNIVDKVLYVSELQKQELETTYGRLPSQITGNYVNPRRFSFSPRTTNRGVIGRLSRPDPLKYPEDFPVFYECMDLPVEKFRVMAWSQPLATKYRWHHFDNRWELLAPLQESQESFLQSLDLFVYPLGHRFRESWGRSTVEAMLTGCIPLVPHGHHLERLLIHGEVGYVCQDFEDFQQYANLLLTDNASLTEMSHACRRHAVSEICDAEAHKMIWRQVLS